MFLAGCNQKLEMSNSEGHKLYYDTIVKINSSLVKYPTDTLDISWKGNWWDGKVRPNKNYPFSFGDEEGICNLTNDTLKIYTHHGYGPSNSLEIRIVKNIFFVNMIEHDCTYGHEYKTLQQSLSINKSTFKIGDTLIGELFYQGIYVWDSVKNVIDTTTISGKFKLKIRNKNFDSDSLVAENNYKRLLVNLLELNPDSTTILFLVRCGLKSLPTELRKFKNLESLVLDGNNFKEVDLSMLCEFKKLKFLQISNCNLIKIPQSIFCLKALEKLDLFNNEIQLLPTGLFQLTNITELQLGGNLLTSLPEEILNFKKLKMLDISGRGSRNNIKKLPANFFKVMENLLTFYPPDSLYPKKS